ncbi:hypothetical protein LJR016_001137 [Devosia sp. LjRoot16]|jgi:hypothetical protein|uniref:hypothetical protein n=1 Tax=Devosia sp. LjRoot16 TaxID=3342271 RepID=UPI003ECD0BD0
MAIMMIAEIAGQTPGGYEATLKAVSEAMKSAPGFLMHSAHQTETGWRVIEVWEARENSAQFFAAHVAPNLPAGIHPKVTFQPLHAVVTP